LRLEATAEGTLMSKPAIHPRIILCLDPAAARAPGKPGKAGAAGAKPPAPDATPAAAPPLPEPPTGVAAPDYPNITNWTPQRVEGAMYEVEGAGSFKKVTPAELDAMAAAAAKAAKEAYEAIPSAPPAGESEGGAAGPGGAEWR
jgi:hypothetical protein